MSQETTFIFGGIVGVVLTALFNHFSRRWERRQEKTDAINRELRDMIRWRLRATRDETSYALALDALREGSGIDLARSFVRGLMKSAADDGSALVWQPYRVPDHVLRDMCEKINELSSALHMETLRVLDGRSNTYSGSVMDRIKCIGSLEKRIYKRLDELKW